MCVFCSNVGTSVLPFLFQSKMFSAAFFPCFFLLCSFTFLSSSAAIRMFSNGFHIKFSIFCCCFIPIRNWRHRFSMSPSRIFQLCARSQCATIVHCILRVLVTDRWQPNGTKKNHFANCACVSSSALLFFSLVGFVWRRAYSVPSVHNFLCRTINERH